MPTQNSDTQNSDIFQNSDTLFALTKMFATKYLLAIETFFQSENDFSKFLTKIPILILESIMSGHSFNNYNYLASHFKEKRNYSY